MKNEMTNVQGVNSLQGKLPKWLLLVTCGQDEPETITYIAFSCTHIAFSVSISVLV